MNHYLEQAAGRTIKTEEGEFLYFGGTSYLGLQTNSQFQSVLVKNIRQLGTNFGASRKANVRLSVFEEFESHIAESLSMEDAICLSSGFLAGQMLSHYFSKNGIKQFIAPNTHPAIMGASNFIYKDYKKLADEINTSKDEHVLFLDSIDFDANNFPDFTWLKNIDLRNTILVVDDSHGFGLIGETGFGISRILGKLNLKELIVCGSLGKALATPCGIISGNRSRLDDLRTSGFYGGGSPPSPAALKTFLDSKEIIEASLQNLRLNIKLFNTGITENFKAIRLLKHPVFTYHDEELTDFLYSKKIITTNFHYPLPDSALLSKVVLSAAHSKEDILKLVHAINGFYSKE